MLVDSTELVVEVCMLPVGLCINMYTHMLLFKYNYTHTLLYSYKYKLNMD